MCECVYFIGFKLAAERRQRGKRAVKEAENKPNGETIDKQRLWEETDKSKRLSKQDSPILSGSLSLPPSLLPSSTGWFHQPIRQKIWPIDFVSPKSQKERQKLGVLLQQRLQRKDERS